MHAYQEKRLYRNIEVRKSWITRNLWFLVRNRELTVGMELKRHLARIHLESVVSKTLREILAHSPRKPWLSVTEDYKGFIHDLCPDLAGLDLSKNLNVPTFLICVSQPAVWQLPKNKQADKTLNPKSGATVFKEVESTLPFTALF